MNWKSNEIAHWSLDHSTFCVIPRLHHRQVGWYSAFDSAVFALEFFVLFSAFSAAFCFLARLFQLGDIDEHLFPRMPWSNNALHRNSRCAFHVRCFIHISIFPLRSTTAATGCG